MNRTGRVILITLLESFACTLVQRGLFFFTDERLGFSDVANLWLAIAFGAAYVPAAFVSHKLAERFGEKRLMIAAIIGQAIVFVSLAICPFSVAMFIGNALLGAMNGMKWPVVESYVSAGWTPKQASRAIGLFCLTWACSVPIALMSVGPLIEYWPPSLFLLGAVLSTFSVWMSFSLPARPSHLPHDHPERPDEDSMRRLLGLTRANRWLLFASYGSAFVLAPLMPEIFKSLGFGVVASPALSSVLEWLRLIVFAVMLAWVGWQGKLSILWLSIVAMPIGFFLVLFSGNLPAVIAGEVLFGIAAGTVYYSALYYGMVAKNASVHAGGQHESLIGLGLVLGPLAGLLGSGLSDLFGNDAYGMLLGIAPLFIICSAGAILAVSPRLARS